MQELKATAAAEATRHSDAVAELQRQIAAIHADYRRKQTEQVSASPGSDMFRQLRALVMKELHPDNAPAGMDRVVRQEVFKAIWPKIEAMTEP